MPRTSTPASTRDSATSRSLGGSNQLSVHTVITRASGSTSRTPRVNALAPRTICSMGNGFVSSPIPTNARAIAIIVSAWRRIRATKIVMSGVLIILLANNSSIEDL